MIEIEGGLQQLNAVTQDDLELSDDDDEIEIRAPAFASFFERLRTLMSENVETKDRSTELSAKTVHEVAQTPPPALVEITFPDPYSPRPKKRASSLGEIPAGSKKNRVDPPPSNLETPQVGIPRTPDRPTTPRNPYYSGDSIESINEDDTKLMISTFIEQSIGYLGKEFRGIGWPSYAQKCRLKISGYFVNLNI